MILADGLVPFLLHLESYLVYELDIAINLCLRVVNAWKQDSR